MSNFLLRRFQPQTPSCAECAHIQADPHAKCSDGRAGSCQSLANRQPKKSEEEEEGGGGKYLLSEPSERLHRGAGSSPVHCPPVLAFLQQVLAALEVRVLVEDPPASQDPAGVNLPPVELLQNGETVLRHFEHLTGKVPLDV